MKRKAVLRLTPIRPTGKGDVVTVQTTEGILVLNCWKDRRLTGRYCMNLETTEYACYFEEEGNWRETKLGALLEGGPYFGWYSYYSLSKETKFEPASDEAMVMDLLKERHPYGNDAIVAIGQLEEEYSSDKRIAKEGRRLQKIRQKMDRVPELPEDFGEWIHKVAAQEMDYAFFDREKSRWGCTSCGKSYEEGRITGGDRKKKIRNNDRFVCPVCGKHIQAKKRAKGIALNTHAILLQDTGPDMGVARHLDIRIEWEGHRRTVRTSEAVRILLLRDNPRYACELYYNQESKGSWGNHGVYFDNKNPANRRISEGYLYPGDGIAQALAGTVYGPWTRIFMQMAEAGLELDYNRMMYIQGNRKMIGITELLFKGRFQRLLRDTIGGISFFSADYSGPLNIHGQDIEDVFGIQDRQKINRIRECNGGAGALNWMKWSEGTGRRIDQETLEWLTDQKVEVNDVAFIADRMSPRQVMNYIEKQGAGQYRNKSPRSIISQWGDYLSMCGNLGKDVHDEMVYRPRELKRRHDEAVEETRKRRMMEQLKRDRKANAEMARRMREKYPGAEEILKEIAPKYEYKGELYMIMVPRDLSQIAAEGAALHHCAGSSERYFERIMQRETYICFLRRKSEPEIPYYTIEVEPGGTIRQHRSYLDEEPGIEEIRGFLREWQRVIRKRLTEADHQLARESAIKRQKNIQELKENNNTRVLKGLEEDFMEAV